MRERFLARGPEGKGGGKPGEAYGGDTGISPPWYRWLKQVFDQLIATINAITGLTITSSTQANLAALGPTLQPNSLVWVTDFGHLLRWTGSTYEWGPGEQGSGFITAFLTDPTAAGWALCNGATVDRLNADGTVTGVTLPNYATSAYLKLGTSAAAGPTAASGVSGATSAGTPSGTVTIGNNDANQDVQAGTGTLVAADPHSHAGTFAGNALATHTHSPGTLELRRSQLKAYFRQ